MALNFGIVGYGAWGGWHAKAVGRTPGVRLHGVCDITPARREAASKELGCPTTDDLKAFLAQKDLDAVVVTTPSHAHVEPVLAALKAGKHVLCEKPVAQTERLAKRLYDAAERAGRLLMTFQNRRYDRDFLATKKAVESGKLGRLYDLRYFHWGYADFMCNFGAKGYQPGWRTMAAYGGGVLMDFGPHYVDQLLQLVPQPVESVYAILHARRWSTEVDDHFALTVRFAEDIVGVVEITFASHAAIAPGWRIAGESGGFVYQGDQGTLTTRAAKGKPRLTKMSVAADQWDSLYRNFRDAVAGKAEPAVRPAQTLRLMRVLDAAARSAATGKAVAVQDVYAEQSQPRSKRRR